MDDCWCHGHEHKNLPVDGPNVDLWTAKIAANRERDARTVAIAESLGWRPVRVWECEIQDNVGRVVDRISQMAKSDESSRGSLVFVRGSELDSDTRGLRL